jgi:predicted metal-dependent peptidase
MPNLENKISQAKAKLLVNYPLFGTIASKLELIADDDIKSFKSDGITLRYNNDFLEQLTSDEMEFVFANGAMHASMAYDMRKNNRSGWLWHLSTDYAINDMLVENGLERPDDANYSQRFSGMYAEEIYYELKADILRDELEYEADDIDDVQNEDSQTTQNEELTQEEQLFEEFVQSVVLDEADKDALPLDMERFFTFIESPKVDWKSELRYAVERFHKDDYTLMPPNKKFIHMGYYLPSSTSNTVRIVVAIDSSGSIDEKLLNIFLSELNFLMNVVGYYEIDLLVCDDKIRSHKKFYSGDILQADIIGGGATDFRPVFDFIDEKLDDINLLLYFTDLDGIFPKDEPRYNVKWVSKDDIEIPFGEVIKL